ncbi:hypothetical protein KA078_02100 [Candidatus Woesebacteria bacterium]|nr:hypothetical protein [Candidatus Woesebacteria bacterium]
MVYDGLLATLGGFFTVVFFILLNLSLGDHKPNAPRGSWGDQRANIKLFLTLTGASALLTIIGLLGWGWGTVILPLLLIGAAGIFIMCLVQMGFDIYRYLRS